MRVVIFTEIMAPYVSGISSYVEVLRKGLMRQGHKVLVVTSSLHTNKAVIKSGVVRCPAKKSLNKYGYECKNINDRLVLNFVSDFRPDVVHIQTDTKIGYMGLQIADKLRIPVVFTVHDYFLDRFASNKSHLIWKIKTYFEKQHFCDMIDNANVITSSNKRAAKFVHDAGRKRRIMLIPAATDKKRFDYSKSTPESIEKMRIKLRLPKKALVAVFAGDLSIDKNIEFVLSAFAGYIKKSDNIHFLVVGDGTELHYLKSTAAKMRISDRVHFTGVVSHSIMPDIYSACDAYVCSSDDGLMSMSFVEAMSCGLPVLVKEDSEKFVHNMIKNGVNGFAYTDAQEFAQYLKTMAAFGSYKKERMKYIVRSSLKNCDAENMADATVKAYKAAIKAYRISVEFVN